MGEAVPSAGTALWKSALQKSALWKTALQKSALWEETFACTTAS